MGTWPHLDEFPGHLTPFSSDFESFSAMQWLNSIYRCTASTPTQGKFLEDIYGKTRNEFDDSHVSLVSISLLLKQTHPTATQWSCFGNILCNQYIFLSVRIFLGWKYLDSQWRCPGGPELATFQGLSVRIFLGWKYLDSQWRCPGGPELATFQISSDFELFTIRSLPSSFASFLENITTSMRTSGFI